MAMGRIFINGKEITEKEFSEICKQERKARVQKFIENTKTEKWYVYDDKVFEDIDMPEEYAKENYYAFDEEDVIEISKDDIIKYAYDDDYIITIEQWEEEHQLAVEYDDYNYTAYLATMCYREIHGLL